MTVLRHLLTGFMAGELDPHLEGRVETEQYAYGLSVCENFIPLNEGPLVKRQGYMMIRDAAATAEWLSPFRRSIDQEYVLEWSEEAVRFFTNGQRIESDPVTPYEVAVPYAAIEAARLSHQQSFNRLYLNHGSYPPAALRRDTATTFTYEVLGLENGPFLDTNSDESVTVTASAATGTPTLTASDPIFDADMVGSLIRLEAKDFADIKQWEPGMDGVSINDKCHNEGRVYQAASPGTTGSVEPRHSEGTYWDGQNLNDLLNAKGPYGVQWTYLHDRFGIAEITGFNSTTSVDAEVLRRLPDSLTAGSYKWAFQAFSEYEGWPSLVAIYKGRRIDIKDLYVIGSVVDDYGGGRVNYSTYSSSGLVTTDLGFRRTISAEDPPLWLSGDRKLLAGTATRELAIGQINAGSAFSGENIEAEPQSFYGSESVFPVQIGTETIFVERGGRRLRSADYDFGRDRYDAQDLTAAARHITDSGIKQLGYQRIPHALVYAVREDGQMVVHPKTRAEIKGFARFVLGGGARLLSSVSVVGEDGKTDDNWALIEREDGSGATVREVWKQASWRELGLDVEESFYVDAGVRVDASANDGDFTGITHLADQEVVALVNGVVVRDLTVASDGSLSLPEDAVPEFDYVAIIGLPYTATATTTRPHIRTQNGGTTGLRQRVTKLVTRMLETLGLKVAAPGQPTPEEVVLRRGEQLMDEQIPLYSGDSDGLVDAEFDTSGRATWIHDDPLPCTITLGVLNVDVSQRDE